MNKETIKRFAETLDQIADLLSHTGRPDVLELENVHTQEKRDACTREALYKLGVLRGELRVLVSDSPLK